MTHERLERVILGSVTTEVIRDGRCSVLVIPPGMGGRTYDYAEVVAALTRGIAETWEVDLIPCGLTSEERRLSEHLRATKYRSEAWTWHW